MEPLDVYVETRQKLLELAVRLGPDQVATPVPALPGWTVKETFAHVTGVCADVLDGNMTDAGSPAWSARQLRERERASLAQVCAEWSSRRQEIDQWLRAAQFGGSFLCFDVWSHEQDIRSAIGMAGRREGIQVPYLAASAAVPCIDHLHLFDPPVNALID
jgi:uncharacterized protein (TIGR03083 family)